MFTTDSRTETFLDLIGAKWAYSNAITFADLAHAWDAKNLGRSQIQIEGAIAEYGSLMDRGSAAPAPILSKNGDGFYEVLDGIQRLLTERVRKPVAFSAYVVESDSYKFNEVMKELKTRMKRPPQPAGLVTKNDNVRFFNLEDVATTSRRDQFTTLGMFVAIATILGMNPAFRTRGAKSPIAGCDDRHMKRAVRWMRHWIGVTKEDDRRHFEREEMLIKHTGKGSGA